MKTKTVHREGHHGQWRGCGWFLATAGALAAGCGPAADSSPTPSDTEAIASVAQAVIDCSTVPKSAPPSSIKQVLTLAKDTLNMFGAMSAKDPSGVSIATNVITFVIDHLIGGAPDISGTVMEIKQELDCISQGLDWKVTALAWNDDQYAPVETAFMDLAQGFPIGSDDDINSHTGTLAAGGLPMFERTFVPSSTNGDGTWKGIIDDHNPDIIDTDQVFDWRFGFPRFVSLIAKRLAIIAKLNPAFISDGSRNPELEGTTGDPGYRLVLQQRLQQMISGVRCQSKDRFDVVQGGQSISISYNHTDIACADVNTGLSGVSQYTLQGTDACRVFEIAQIHYDAACMANLPDQANVAAVTDSLRRQLLSQMPIFEVQSMTDTLYHFTHPAPDLTEAFGRVPAGADRGLCLDVINGDPTPGTPVWLYWCTGSVAQQWSYDRKTQTLTNTAFGKCLEVNPIVISIPFVGTVLLDNRNPGALAVIADCISPPPVRQLWSYDPETSVLRSAEGTVLDVRGGTVVPMNPVFLWDFHGGANQQWHADVSEAYCSNSCTPVCESSCAGTGPQRGVCIGSCMASCIGDCMSVN